MTILVTGCAGYIGSHACVELLEQDYNVVGIDNFANGHRKAIDRIEEITGKQVTFYEADIRDSLALANIFQQEKIDAVIHFAGYKAVGESVEKPMLYYSNNVAGTINLLKAMKQFKVSHIVFSSSCTVYGNPETVPVTEGDSLAPTNPYGRSKLMVEQVLQDYFKASDGLSVSILRYFNPIGAHPSGKIGEDPKGIPNNLLPYIACVAVGKLNNLQIFGSDYDTKDGTGVRDYIHVVDLVKAHIYALEELMEQESMHEIYNLGTGQGYSVLDVIGAFEKASGKKIPYEFTERRPGDVDKTFSNPSKANQKSKWVAQRNLDDMCANMWNWQKQNPDGFN